jgi:hypothetical protein
MWRYARAQTIAACCERTEKKPAPISRAEYTRQLRTAEDLGVREDLEQYLKRQGEFRPAKAQQSGLVHENFFIPSPGMLAFRRAAGLAMTAQKVWALKDLPCFWEWFWDWTMPGKHFGERCSLPAPKQGPAPQGGVTSAAGDGANAADAGPPRKPRPGAEHLPPDGPAAPDVFWFAGERYDDLPPLEWRLLSLLWDASTHAPRADATAIQDAIDALYGDNADRKEKAFSGVLKRLRTHFADLPLELRTKGGYIVLARFKSD